MAAAAQRNINTFRQPPLHDKPVEMTLAYIWETGQYKVQHVKNTTWYRPDDLLTQEVIDGANKIPGWTLDFVSFDLIKKVFGFVKPNLSIL